MVSYDADVARASQRQHAVEDVDSECHFGCLTLVGLRAQRMTDDPFPAADIGFHQGKVCAIAATEAEAVSAPIRNRPDLMIVDAGLGRGSGISAVDEILRAGSLAHVFISGDADMVRAHRPEAVILRKPFCEAELVKAIEAALDAVAG